MTAVGSGHLTACLSVELALVSVVTIHAHATKYTTHGLTGSMYTVFEAKDRVSETMRCCSCIRCCDCMMAAVVAQVIVTTLHQTSVTYKISDLECIDIANLKPISIECICSIISVLPGTYQMYSSHRKVVMY